MYLIKYTGDGQTTEFNFVFPFFKSADVIVSVNSEILPSGSFNVNITEDVQHDGMYSGGNVIFSEAPASGAEICIWRKISLSRVIDYQPTLPIQPENLNADFNFVLEYLKDLYELDGDVANIQNGLQFLDGIQEQIEKLGDFGELARKDEIPDTSGFAPINHTHNMSAYATKMALEGVEFDLSKEIEENAFPIKFGPEDTTDAIVKMQLPSAENNYSWNRLYKSGWVEQGGVWSGSLSVVGDSNATVIISIPIEMADSNYCVNWMNNTGFSTGIVWFMTMSEALTTTSFQIHLGAYESTRNFRRMTWQICGMAAAQ